MLYCMRMPNFIQIGPCIAELWRQIDFQDGSSQPCCICFEVIADHPRSAYRGLNSVFKSRVRRINSSGDIATYRFWRFGLKLPIAWGSWINAKDSSNHVDWSSRPKLVQFQTGPENWLKNIMDRSEIGHDTWHDTANHQYKLKQIWEQQLANIWTGSFHKLTVIAGL